MGSAAITFFLLALVAAFFGFSGLAASMAGLAKILLVLFIVGFVISLVMGRRSPAL